MPELFSYLPSRPFPFLYLPRARVPAARPPSSLVPGSFLTGSVMFVPLPAEPVRSSLLTHTHACIVLLAVTFLSSICFCSPTHMHDMFFNIAMATMCV